MPRKQSPDTSRAEDGAIAIYHVMRATEDFETTATMLFTLVGDAAREFPGKPRRPYLDVEGHRNHAGGYDRDAYEIFSGFILGFHHPYLTEIPTVGGRARNPDPRRDDLPDLLTIKENTSG